MNNRILIHRNDSYIYNPVTSEYEPNAPFNELKACTVVALSAKQVREAYGHDWSNVIHVRMHGFVEPFETATVNGKKYKVIEANYNLGANCVTLREMHG